MVEVACENTNNCNNDQKSFKAYLVRWMAATATVAPFTVGYVKQKLAASGLAAAQQCNGGATGTKCGLKWFQRSQNDGSTGPGQQMAALEAVQSNMLFLSQPGNSPAASQASPAASPQTSDSVPILRGPVTADTGGTSKGDPNAGTIPSTWSGKPGMGPIKAGDKAGAAFATMLLVGIISVCGVWINQA